MPRPASPGRGTSADAETLSSHSHEEVAFDDHLLPAALESYFYQRTGACGAVTVPSA